MAEPSTMPAGRVARPSLPLPASTIPGAPTLTDACGRAVTYLRLSVTERCNFRCCYCSRSPEPPTDALSPGEIGRLVRLFARMGVRRVRLTGGEPTLRRDLLAIVDEVRAAPGITEVALTTNGHRLVELAEPLRQAGVECLNVSLDTLDPARFEVIGGRGARLSRVLEGIDAAATAGFAHLKLNSVVMGGINEDELGALVGWAWSRNATPRFIEKMPFGDGHRVPIAEVKRLLGEQGIALQPDAGRGWGPAHYLRGDDGAGGRRRVGFIGAMTEPFCRECSRVRISSLGDLHPCLSGEGRVPLRPLMRDGASEEALERTIRTALLGKAQRHRMEALSLSPMVRIGG